MIRQYPRGALAAINNAQLGAAIDAATGHAGTDVSATRLVVIVDHPDLGARDDTAVLAAIQAYVFDPAYGVPPPADPTELRDARTAVDQDDLKTAVRRLGDYALRLARGN